MAQSIEADATAEAFASEPAEPRPTAAEPASDGAEPLRFSGPTGEALSILDPVEHDHHARGLPPTTREFLRRLLPHLLSAPDGRLGPIGRANLTSLTGLTSDSVKEATRRLRLGAPMLRWLRCEAGPGRKSGTLFVLERGALHAMVGEPTPALAPAILRGPARPVALDASARDLLALLAAGAGVVVTEPMLPTTTSGTAALLERDGAGVWASTLGVVRGEAIDYGMAPADVVRSLPLGALLEVWDRVRASPTLLVFRRDADGWKLLLGPRSPG